MDFYFNKPEFKLLYGDSFKYLKKFENDSFDMIFADPPYFLSNGSFSCKNGKMVSVKKANWDMGNSFSENYNFHLNWLQECYRILKPNGSIWLSGTYHSIYQCGFALQMLNFHILNDIIWFKPNASPNLSCRFFTASHETLIWAKKNKKAKHCFNYENIKNWDNNYSKKIKCEYCNNTNSIEISHKKGVQMRSVWIIPTTPKEEKNMGKHPTQKPLELLNRVIISSTNKNDIILDPFCGSSTTGISAKIHKRKFIGIDNEKEYLDLSINRYNTTKEI